MLKNRHEFIHTLYRCAALQCPACGKSSIVEKPFFIKHHCPTCGALFMREDGFFVGAIMANVVTTELVILTFYLISLLTVSDDFQSVLNTLFTVALIFPVAFYHHSWSVWLCLDYSVESLPQYHQPEEENPENHTHQVKR
ncbi:MAG: hypothetical protein H0W76_12400 [Pyrinomonadaceae bacterium]|nr:hypothetical protein [Pyrinomonadaceae bacterium]